MTASSWPSAIPDWSTWTAWSSSCTRHHLRVPAIGTGQAWGEEGLSFTDPDPVVRQAAIERIKSHIPGRSPLGAVIIMG